LLAGAERERFSLSLSNEFHEFTSHFSIWQKDLPMDTMSSARAAELSAARGCLALVAVLLACAGCK